MKLKRSFLGIVAAIIAVGILATAATASITGAIYTTLGDGTSVNANLYPDRESVYLNGGPQNANGSGLPDGVYFFQVTDPPGSTLLSTDDAVNRQVYVINGVVSGAVPTGTGTPYGTVAAGHVNGLFNPANGSTGVQLWPYNVTPNGGGEYKVWLIRQVDVAHSYSHPLAKIDPNDSRVILFDHNNVKTDNFKVKTSDGGGGTETVLSGTKFYDANVNGVNDGELPLEGVEVDIYTGDGTIWNLVDVQFTDANGSWTSTITDSPDEFYRVCEVVPGTGENDGSYWMQTAPAADANGDRCYEGELGAATIDGLNFGNVCVHPATGGLTLGYWSNKNGQAQMKGTDCYATAFGVLNPLFLRNAAGADQNFAASQTGYNNFRTWILNATATNMAYMLSAQLAATELDVNLNGLSGSTIVLLSDDPDVALCYGANVASINDVMSAANTSLGLYPITKSGNAQRDYQECLKDILDDINNNRLRFVSPTPCNIVYP